MSAPKLTTTQHSALGDLRRFGRLYPPGPRQRVERGTVQGFSRRTLQSLVDAGHAEWAPRRDGTWPSIVPTDPPSDYAERATADGHPFRATALVPGWCVRCGCSRAVHQTA